MKISDIRKCSNDSDTVLTTKCFLCKGDMVEGFTTHTVDTDNSMIVIKDVPAMICSQCGEVWFDGTVARRIEKTVNAIESTTIATEVSIVNYSHRPPIITC
jgi:YgiT-type zinc finger domain-containing protein